MSYKQKAGIGSSSTVNYAFECLEFGVVSSKPHIHTNGFRGTRGQFAARTIEGVEEVKGPLRVAPTLADLAVFLPWCGFSVSSGAYTVTEGLTARYLACDQDTKVPVFSSCYVNAFDIKASKGAAWEWTFDVIGSQETVGNSGTFPSLTIADDAPMALHHATISIGGTQREIVDLSIRVDNAIDAQSFNAAYHTSFEPQDRIVTTTITVPYTSANSDLRRPSVAGLGLYAAITYGGHDCDIAMGSVQFPRGAVVVQGKSRLFLQLTGQSRIGTNSGSDDFDIVFITS